MPESKVVWLRFLWNQPSIGEDGHPVEEHIGAKSMGGTIGTIQQRGYALASCDHKMWGLPP